VTDDRRRTLVSRPPRALLESFAIVALASLGLLVAACAPADVAPSTVAGGSGAPGTIAVTASEFTFSPSAVTTRAGNTTFVVTNAGIAEHEFEILKGDQVVDEVEGLVPGITREISVDLAAGSYTYVCRLSGHEEAGMKGTLTVTD
jgi:iron uptake system component EfeO